jgi:HD domain
MSDIWIETFSGRRFDLFDPDPESVYLPDIAHALSIDNRFAGHTSKSYSVAEHSLWVWKLVSLWAPDDYLLQLYALLHDAHEYATGDITGPMKAMIRALVRGLARHDADPVGEVEDRVQTAICAALGIPVATEAQEAIIKTADAIMLVTEAHCPALCPNRQNVWSKATAMPHHGILSGEVGLEPAEILPAHVHDDNWCTFIRLPSRAALQDPPGRAITSIPRALFENDIAFLFQHNVERLLALVKNPPR